MDFINRFKLDMSGARILFETTPPEWLSGLHTPMSAILKQFQIEDEEGYESLVKRLRAWTWSHKIPEKHPDHTPMQNIATLAKQIKDEAKAFITVGIGGSDLGARTLHDMLNHPYHNEMVATGQLKNVPEIYFTGDTFDPIRLHALLDMLKVRNLLDKTIINIVSKSGTTAETALAGMVLANALGDDWMSRTVATTGLSSKSLLYQMQEEHKGKFMAMLPVPDGVGGRFSFASPVGLLFLAVTAPHDPMARLQEAMNGYQEAHDTFLSHEPDQNPAFQLARYLQIAEVFLGRTSLVFYPYFDNSKLGDWFVQLYEESLQERGSGLNIMPTTGPTGNHSLLNGIVNGARDKVILFLAPEYFGNSISVPQNAPLAGSLTIFKGIPFEAAQLASLKGTMQDFNSRSIPNALLTFPKRDTSSTFALMRILMDMVAVKGRLRSLHLDPITGERKIEDEDTYIQTGVEGYKKRMRENIDTAR